MTELELLRDKVAVLEARIAELTRPFRKPLPRCLGLSPQEDTLLSALASAKPGEVYSNDRLLYAISPDPFDVADNGTRVVLYRVRRKAGRFGITIETVWAQGYRLTPEGRRALAELVASEEAAAHG